MLYMDELGRLTTKKPPVFTLTCLACCRDYRAAERRRLAFCPSCANEVTVWTDAERRESRRWRKENRIGHRHS